MSRQLDSVHHFGNYIYIQFHALLLACGSFLSPSEDAIDQHLKMHFDRWHGPWERRNRERFIPDGIWAARLIGDSMKNAGIRSGNIAIIRRFTTADLEGNRRRSVVVEKLGDEEGRSSLTLKHLIVVKEASCTRNVFNDEIDCEGRELVLYPSNPDFNPMKLGPEGRYRVLGVYLRSISFEDEELIESAFVPQYPDHD